MKANEAPEKLYITNDEKRFSDKCHSASTEKYIDNDIEYTRTDAFIEKAADYINCHLALLDTENNNCMPKWLEKFKEAMKGE